ncbi:hypothetical protein [Abyssicoccus albus]|uniref:Uncharacterized protein n=1 Tax=Abyssicoccus albus TaxID=1817405 RepID=A0A1Q1G043_9BACL|nr:hypothetical protein [Abyssicoccus albus]AQL55722.1 hypothetical protein BVH56_01525 [Abyssicoccus albus]RPF56420.1 hypothetical protein EDD62_1056 [Abyssicoccus albus]
MKKYKNIIISWLTFCTLLIIGAIYTFSIPYFGFYGFQALFAELGLEDWLFYELAFDGYLLNLIYFTVFLFCAWLLMETIGTILRLLLIKGVISFRHMIVKVVALVVVVLLNTFIMKHIILEVFTTIHMSYGFLMTSYSVIYIIQFLIDRMYNVENK